jgi:hypothetical protein
MQVEELGCCLKADVLGSLPPKKEQIVRVELAAPQRALYKSLLTNSYQTLISGRHPCSVWCGPVLPLITCIHAGFYRHGL